MTTSELTFVKEATDPARLAAYSKDASPYVRRAVARHSLTSAATLAALGKDTDPRVRLAVAANANTPVATLEALYERDSHRRPHALALAGNESTHDYLLTLLLKGVAHHGLSEVAARRKTLPAGLVDWLVEGADTLTGVALARRGDLTVSQYTKLSQHTNVWVRKTVCENTSAPESVREQLRAQKLHLIAAPWELGLTLHRRGLAGRDKTDQRTLSTLARDPNSYIRKAVAYNPNTALVTLEYLAGDENSYVRRAVAEHPNVTPEILARFVKDKNEFVRESAARSHNATTALLTRFSRDRNAHVREKVGEHTETSLRVLKRLAEDDNVFVRAAVASNPAHDGAAAEILIYDGALQVNRKLATNPACPQKTLIRLALSDDEETVTAAREQLGLPLGAFRSTIYSILRERGEEL